MYAFVDDVHTIYRTFTENLNSSELFEHQRGP